MLGERMRHDPSLQGIAAVYTSDLGRTVQTTEAILAEVRKNKDIIREEMEKGEDKIQKKVQEILQAGFIFGRLARDPNFDNVTRRH